MQQNLAERDILRLTFLGEFPDAGILTSSFSDFFESPCL